MAHGKGNKHGGHKTRIKNYRRSKHRRLALASRRNRQGKQQGE